MTLFWAVSPKRSDLLSFEPLIYQEHETQKLYIKIIFIAFL